MGVGGEVSRRASFTFGRSGLLGKGTVQPQVGMGSTTGLGMCRRQDQSGAAGGEDARMSYQDLQVGCVWGMKYKEE